MTVLLVDHKQTSFISIFLNSIRSKVV